MASSTVTSKGQITIPLEVRRRLGLKQGDKVEFLVEEGKTVLRPLQPAANPFEEWLGAFPAFSSRDEIVRFYRDLRGHDEADEEIL